MSDAVVCQILGEIDELPSASECRLTVLHCEAAIHAVDVFEGHEPMVLGGGTQGRHQLQGRGGTDLRPPFAWVQHAVEQEGQAVDALIYCTDGFGPMPDRPPEWPLLWIVPRHGLPAFAFGAVARVTAFPHSPTGATTPRSSMPAPRGR
jgi:predicted metal-dependent peptidase